MVVSSGRGRPIDCSRARVGPPRPEASTTRSAAIVSLAPLSFSQRTPVTTAPSGDANTSLTRQRWRNVVVARLSTLSHGALDRRPGRRVTRPAEIALREGIVTRAFDANIETGPERHGSRPREILFESREQLAEGALAAEQKPMDVPRLRRPGPIGGELPPSPPLPLRAPPAAEVPTPAEHIATHRRTKAENQGLAPAGYRRFIRRIGCLADRYLGSRRRSRSCRAQCRYP